MQIGFKRWRYPLAITILIIVEFPFTVAILALTGIADPDTYRTKLWRDGHLNGFNSDPSTPLYAAANYRPVHFPLVWSQLLTKYELVIAVLSMFVLLVKSVMAPLRVLWPIISIFIHALETGLYAFSVYGQTSPDTIDPKHINNGPPWFITKSCSVAALKDNVGFCQQAKSTFIVTVFLLAIFAIHIILCIHSIFFAPPPIPEEDEESIFDEPKSAVFKDENMSMFGMSRADQQQWEMVRIPDTPGTTGGIKSPVTPRTMAFNTLQGGGGGRSSATRELPFREMFPPPPKKAKKGKK